MSLLVQIALCLYLLPAEVLAQTTTTTVTTIKDPLNYPLKQYGLMLFIAILGGSVNWYLRARRGEALTLGISGLIGEIATASFAGLLTFWLCEYFNLGALLTPCLVGMAGHAGGRGIVWAEAITRRRVEKTFGFTAPAHLGKD